MVSIQRVMIRSRRVDTVGAHGDPWEAEFMYPGQLPAPYSQFTTPDGRAFSVSLIKWRYDIGEVHLFCVEYTKKAPLEGDNSNG